MIVKKIESLSESDISLIIEMAWKDRVSFEAIKNNFHIDEKNVIKIMKSNLKKSSYQLWRKRVSGRKMKHLHKNKEFNLTF
tara:strand:+ start:718 stop:960 length:243 start_codon:yes stop_codon:yes gene_type:complete